MKLKRLQSFHPAILFFILIFLSAVIHCEGQANSPHDSLVAKMAFESDTVNYGNISFTSSPYKTIKVYNAGKEPLLIENVVGDVVQIASYSREPILGGQYSEIRIVYPISTVGPFINFIAITTNLSNSPKIIFVKGNIVPLQENSSKK